MKKDEILNLLKETGAMLEGHFLLTSGLHSDKYIEKFKIFQFPKIADQLGRYIGKHFEKDRPTVVAGAAIGGIILSHAVARYLGIRSIFAERVDGKLQFRRGFNIEKGERTLIVEDIVTTGGSVIELVDLVFASGGFPVGVGIVVNRSKKKVDFCIPQFSLLRLSIDAFPPNKCPLCKKGIPLTTRGRTGKSQK